MNTATRHRPLVLALTAIALMAAAFRLDAPRHDALAQDGDPDRDALVQRAIDAAAASEDFTSFVAVETETSSVESVLAFSGTSLTGVSDDTVTMTTTYTHDADGQPNFHVVYSAEASEQPFGEPELHSYTLEAEVYVVGGVAYLSATRESEFEDVLPPMPDGWVILEDAADWDALHVLQLSDLLENLDSPDIYADNIGLLLTHATEASLEPGTLDDGMPVDVITLVIMGADLRAGLLAFSQAAGEGDSVMTIMYNELSDESVWDIVFRLDDTGTIVSFDSDLQIFLADFPLAEYSPGSPADTMLGMTQTLSGRYAVNDVNAPIEPFEAPAME